MIFDTVPIIKKKKSSEARHEHIKFTRHRIFEEEKKKNSIFIENFSRNISIVSSSREKRNTNSLYKRRIARRKIRNAPCTMMEWRKGKGRKKGKRKYRRGRWRFDECWKLLRQVLLFDKLKNGGASGSFEVWHGSANWPEQWGATQKRKPTKSFNHRATSLLFLLAAPPFM